MLQSKLSINFILVIPKFYLVPNIIEIALLTLYLSNPFLSSDKLDKYLLNCKILLFLNF